MTVHAGASSTATSSRLADDVARLAIAGVVILVALRLVRYAPIQLPELADETLGYLLDAAAFLFIVPLTVALPHAIALTGLLLLVCVAPGVAVTERRAPWRLRSWLHALLWVEIALNHELLDLNPFLALVLAIAIAAGEAERLAVAAGRAASWLAPATALAMIVALALGADTAADAVGGGSLAGGTWWLLARGRRWVGVRERRLLLIAAGVGCQLLAAGLPLVVPTHGGTKLGDGMAYSFCESPAHHALFAAVPRAPTMYQWAPWARHGRDGYVVEYDSASLAERTRHRFFSDRFYGRLEFLLCLRDRVYVGMTNSVTDGRHEQDHAMWFSLSHPGRFGRDAVGGGAGHGIAYDEKRDALFYVSEIHSTVVRIDRRTGEKRRFRVPPTGKVSLVVGQQSTDRRRDALYLAGWLNGREAYELDRATLEVRREFEHRDGGALGLTVDEGLDRLYTVGIWGMEVFDLRTGALVARRRLGLLSRSPAIDPADGLVFVPSTADGKIRVFDRTTLALRGVIAVGFGARIPYFSTTEHRLFSGSSFAHYYWDAETIRRRLR